MSVKDEAVDRYNDLYDKGIRLIKGRILLDKAPIVSFIWPRDRWRLRRAIMHFRQAAAIAPQQWQCRFWIGKAYQRLGDHVAALDAFEQARRLVPDNPSVAKEAANAAMEIGQPSLAIAFLRPATSQSPQDPSLWHNLALALLLVSHADEAQQCIQRALDLDSDPSSRWLAGMIAEVCAGRRRSPVTLSELKAHGAQ